MTMREVPKIPERIKRLPTYRGLPIPYTAYIKDGVPDFRTVNTQAIMRCADRRLCGICGEKLLLKIYFFGGELCSINRMFLDPPMHRECIDFAKQVCPYISADSKTYNENKPLRAKVEINEHVNTKKGRQAIFVTSGYVMREFEGKIYFKANNYIEIEWLKENKE